MQVRIAPMSFVSFTVALKVPATGWMGGNITSVVVSGLGGGIVPEVFGVRFKQRRMTPDGAVYTMAPLLLDPITPPGPTASPGAALRPGVVRRLWCRLTASAAGAMQAGKRTATVTVKFSDGSQPALVLHLPITVTAASLPQPSQWLGYGTRYAWIKQPCARRGCCSNTLLLA
jgi:hypothetical protein